MTTGLDQQVDRFYTESPVTDTPWVEDLVVDLVDDRKETRRKLATAEAEVARLTKELAQQATRITLLVDENEQQRMHFDGACKRAEARIAELTQDRDEWKQACIDGNARFKSAEARVVELTKELAEANEWADAKDDALDILFERTDTEMRRLSTLCGGFVTAVLTITATVDPNTTRDLKAWRAVEDFAQSVKRDLPPVMPLPEAPRTRIPELRAALKEAEAENARLKAKLEVCETMIGAAAIEPVKALLQLAALRAAAKAVYDAAEAEAFAKNDNDRAVLALRLARLSMALGRALAETEVPPAEESEASPSPLLSMSPCKHLCDQCGRTDTTWWGKGLGCNHCVGPEPPDNFFERLGEKPSKFLSLMETETVPRGMTIKEAT